MNAIIFTAIWGIVMMFGGVMFKSKSTVHYWAIAGILLVLGVNILELVNEESIFNIDTRGLLVFKSFNLTFTALMFIATLFYFLLSGREMDKVGESVSEYYALIFFVLCGVSIAASFNSLLTLFLGVEIMSIPLYILTGSDKRNLKSNEASLKYFLMGAFSTGIMIMGIAFLYGGNSNGTFLIDSINLGEGKMPGLLAIGLVFTMIALSFKVSAAPFHFWTPDVYDGAPTVFTSFMATIVKAAGFMAFIRLFDNAFGRVQPQWQILIAVITAATLLIGNITAVFQQSVKRMLAYSSIAQAGFMLFAIFALNDFAKEGLILYSIAYSLATIGIFAVLMRMTDYTIDGFNGLGKQHPEIAVYITVCLLSLTGIPLTAGFQGKFYMLLAAVRNGSHMWLVVFAVLMAAVSAYYYFRVIQAMFFKEPADNNVSTLPAESVTKGLKFGLLVIAILIILLGITPGIVIDWLYY
ncbi:MAG: hypothetical protein RLY16_1166 [Bacteroidota bacterium]|jgi:NADH-quinone oxidoreductase subunit N